MARTLLTFSWFMGAGILLTSVASWDAFLRDLGAAVEGAQGTVLRWPGCYEKLCGFLQFSAPSKCVAYQEKSCVPFRATEPKIQNNYSKNREKKNVDQYQSLPPPFSREALQWEENGWFQGICLFSLKKRTYRGGGFAIRPEKHWKIPSGWYQYQNLLFQKNRRFLATPGKRKTL